MIYLAAKTYLVVSVATGTSHWRVFSIYALIWGIVICNKGKFSFRIGWWEICLLINREEWKIRHTTSLESSACKRERRADLTFAGKPLYKLSLILGGNEMGRDAWKIQRHIIRLLKCYNDVEEVIRKKWKVGLQCCPSEWLSLHSVKQDPQHLAYQAFYDPPCHSSLEFAL